MEYPLLSVTLSVYRLLSQYIGDSSCYLVLAATGPFLYPVKRGVPGFYGLELMG
jgi:hypothetical protein